MTREQPQSRRQVLRRAVGLVGALAWSPLLPALWSRDARRSIARRLCHLLPAIDSARAVGIAYLRATPGEAGWYRLTRLLCRDERERRFVLAAGDPELRTWFGSKRQSDFAAGHVVDLGGWTLSRSEARLCALVMRLTPSADRGAAGDARDLSPQSAGRS